MIYFDNTADTAFAYKRTVDDLKLTFDLSREGDRDILIDREIGSIWIAFRPPKVDSTPLKMAFPAGCVASVSPPRTLRSRSMRSDQTRTCE